MKVSLNSRLTQGNSVTLMNRSSAPVMFSLIDFYSVFDISIYICPKCHFNHLNTTNIFYIWHRNDNYQQGQTITEYTTVSPDSFN